MATMPIDRPKRASFIKMRFLIVIMATLCPVVCYMSRQNLSIAIVSMVNSSSPTEDDDNNNINNINITNNFSSSGNNNTFFTADHSREDIQQNAHCPVATITSADGKLEVAPIVDTFGPRYKWSPSDKSLIFEAFFLMYVVCQIPGARLAEQWGAKWILATATIGSTLISLVSPWAASQHVYLLAFVRGLMGICQTALYPACYVLYTHWLPPTERRQALPVLAVGAYIGSIIASTSTGYFTEQESMGWPYAFYMPSVVCAIWSIVWIFIGSSEPREHRYISLEEIEYIESRMEVKKNDGLELEGQRKSPSWKKIFTSQHIWAMMFGFFASNWAFTITLLLLPSYLNDILLIPPFKNGMINATIYVLFCISSPIVGALSSLMIETRLFGLTHLQTRKFFQCTAVFSQAICFVSLPMLGCDTDIVLKVLYIQIVLYSFVNGGEVQLPSELSFDFAGTIYAIGNCVGSSTGFLVPRVHSFIVTDTHDRESWNTYFYVAAAITTIGGLVFLVFGKNDLQDFSKDMEKPTIESYQLSTDKTSINMNMHPAEVNISKQLQSQNNGNKKSNSNNNNNNNRDVQLSI